MSHTSILKAIVSGGGRLAASFTLDADGRTEGARLTHNRTARCGACGRPGHTVKRCTGPDSEPTPRYDDVRRGR